MSANSSPWSATMRHRAVVAISASELDAGAREKIRAAHGGLVAMIVEALGDMGHDQPRMAAMLLQGIVDAAVRRIELGAAEDPDAITEAAVKMALRGYGAEGLLGWLARLVGG